MDHPLQTRFDRRQLLQGASVVGLGTAAGLGFAAPSAEALSAAVLASACTLTPSLTSGPFYRDLNLVRKDITEGQAGMPMLMYIRVLDVDGCTPLVGAEVDIWHNNAAGHYSNFASKGTSGETWLRGVQFTGADGIASFRTIYPGWYPGRTTHIHAKIYPQTNYELTTQFYFRDDLTNRIYLLPPYSSHGAKDTTNGQDNLFRQQTVMGTIVTFDFTPNLATVVAGLTVIVDRP